MPSSRIKCAGQNSMIAHCRFAVAGLGAAGFGFVGIIGNFSGKRTAASLQGSLSPGFRFTEASGEQLFVSVCQGCHMPDGNGATGAGNYPALVERQEPRIVRISGLRRGPGTTGDASDRFDDER